MFAASPIACTPTGQPASAPSRTICSSSSLVVITTPLPSVIQAVCEPSVPSMNGLEVAEPEEGRAGAAAQPDLAQVAEPLGRCRLPDAERERALLLEALPEPDRAEPAVLVVEAR